MPSTQKPRKRYRPRAVALNATQIAINRVGKLSPEDVDGQVGLARRALREFACGVECARHWCGLADVANMAETLSRMGICSGPDAQTILDDAMAALSAVHTRHRQRGTWTLYPAELDALRWMTTLHARQLSECDYGEFDGAYKTTSERMRQARAGNAPAGAVVVCGEFGA